ncbi:MAG: peptide/nickel transport system ATP-binding protein [Myxococcota bacterium]|jgi:peptide/nickel transport system ATP-binding protein
MSIELTHVSVTLGGNTKALSDICLSIAPGTRVALVGSSGSGKTTLARALFGIVGGVQGSVRVFGRSPTGRAQTAPGTRAQLLFQHPRAMLHPAMTLRQQLDESAHLHNRPMAAVDAVLRQVQLEYRADALPSELSGGQLRRAGIARVLLAQPDLLVADEPTTGLDAAVKSDIVALLMAPERTTLLVTHDIGVAADHTERIVVLHQGRIIDDAPALGALSHPNALALVRASGLLA